MVNCTCENVGIDPEDPYYYQVFNLVAIVIILPILAIFGVASNLVNALVFKNVWKSSSSLYYLMGLALSDVIVNLTSVMIFADSAKTYLPFLRGPVMAHIIIFLVPVGAIGQSCSVYLTLAAIVSCYFDLKRPSQKLLRLSRVKKVTLTVVGCSVLYNAVRFWELRIHACTDENTGEYRNEICATEVFAAVEVIVHAFMDTTLMNIVPYALVSTFTVLTVRAVKASKPAVQRLIELQFMQLEKKRREEMKIGNMRDIDEMMASKKTPEKPIALVSVAILFILSNLLPLITTVLTTVDSQRVPKGPARLLPNATQPLLSYITLHIITDVGNLLVLVNASVNIFIYLSANAAYRKEFVLLRSRYLFYLRFYAQYLIDILWPGSWRRKGKKMRSKSPTFSDVMYHRASISGSRCGAGRNHGGSFAWTPSASQTPHTCQTPSVNGLLVLDGEEVRSKLLLAKGGASASCGCIDKDMQGLDAVNASAKTCKMQSLGASINSDLEGNALDAISSMTASQPALVHLTMLDYADSLGPGDEVL